MNHLLTCGVGVIVLVASSASAQQLETLYGSSEFLHEQCLPPCACPYFGIRATPHGTFDLSLVSIGDVFDFYSISNIQWSAITPQGNVQITGSGQYRISQLAGLQAIELSLDITGIANTVTLESGVVPLEEHLPVIRINAASQQFGCSRVSLSIAAGDASPCPAADLDNGRGYGILDKGVDINDLLYFLAKFEAGSGAVDLSGGPCGCPDCICPDGGVDIADLLFFLSHFERGC